MDPFTEYWKLVVDKNDEIGTELVKYIRLENESSPLSSKCTHYLSKQLQKQPYPIFQIIKLLFSKVDDTKNTYLEEICYNVLMQMIIDLETKKDGASKLFCLLSNIQLSDSFTAKIYEELPPKLVKHKDMLGSDLYMALFSRDRNDLLLHFLSYERETLWPQKNIKSLFLHTVLRKQHWLLALLDSAASLENNFNATLNQHIELFKLIAFCNSSLDNADLWLAFVSKVQKATNFNGAYSDSLKMCHLEVQRQAFLLDFLRANSKFRTIGDVVVKFSILEPLLEHVDFNSNLYTKIEQLLEKNHQLKMEQLSIHQNKVLNLTCNDTHLLREYYIVKLTLDLLLDEIPVGANEQKIISVIKLMFRNIDNVESFVRTVEIVFSLLFLRHEHIRKAKRGSNVESKSMTTSVLTSPPTFYSQMSLSIKLEPPQVGFVCSRRVLEIILNFLRSVCVQRKHSKPSQNCNDSIKLRLKTINDEISEGLWRLTLIPEKTSPFVGSGKVTNFNYQLALKFHKSASDGDNSSERTSEEDQLKQKKVKKPFKRKLKKRVPRATSDGGNDRSSMSVQTSNTDVSDNVRDSAEFEDSSRTKNIICRMLMSPQSLINNSMDNPQAVEQVLEKYKLETSELAASIKFSSNFQLTRKKLQELITKFYIDLPTQVEESNTMIDMIQKVAAIGFETTKISNIIESFVDQNKIVQTESDALILQQSEKNYPYLKQFSTSYLQSMTIADLMISLSAKLELNQTIHSMIIAFLESGTIIPPALGHFRLTQTLMECLAIHKKQSNSDEDITMQYLLTDEIFSLNPKEYSRKLENLKNFNRLMKNKMESELDDDMKAQEMLKQAEFWKCDTNFIGRLHMYVKNVFELLKFYSNENFTFDEVVKLNLYDAINEIVYKKGYEPERVENFVYNIKTNLVYVIACGATEIISCDESGVESNITMLESFLENLIDPSNKTIDGLLKESPDFYQPTIFKISNHNIMYYVKKDNFLLAYLMKEIQKFEYQTLKYDINYLDNQRKLETVETLAVLYNGHITLAALNYDQINLHVLVKHLRSSNNYEHNLKILSSISEKQIVQPIKQLKDFYIEKLVLDEVQSDKGDRKFRYLEKLSNINKSADLLLKSVLQIKSMEALERQLRNILLSKHIDDLNPEYKLEVEQWQKKLHIYKKIADEIADHSSEPTAVDWTKVMDQSIKAPETLLDFLLNKKKAYALAWSWNQIHSLQANKLILPNLARIFVDCLNRTVTDPDKDLIQIIENMPKPLVFEFYDMSLSNFRNLCVLNYIIGYLEKETNSNALLAKYQKYRISLKMMENMPVDDHDLVWRLLNRPLLIIEQYLMNSKLEILTKLIGSILPITSTSVKCPICSKICDSNNETDNVVVFNIDLSHDGNFINSDCVDLLLRLYAAKALDFRIVDNQSTASEMSRHSDTLSLDSLSGFHQMPKDVPNKSNWVKDGEVSTCMCCKRSKFTLLNRRHHCRRCGRVVCHACSQKRLLLSETYADVPVRVCLDCSQQIELRSKKPEEDAKTRTSSISEENEPMWILSGLPKHDNLVREQFSYSYSPNVSLCLSFCQLHSANVECTKFLLYHCHRFEKLLRQKNGEIDYILVARMLHNLALAAKVRNQSSEVTFNKSFEECNTIIENADIILLIVNNGCEALLPTEKIDTQSLRKLRDDLVRAEKWNMAIDISLKLGEEVSSRVLAAWGLSCLKAGCYETAREKFSRCLTRICTDENKKNLLSLIESEQWSLDKEEFSDVRRPNKSPPLLSLIISILESSAQLQQPEALMRASKIISSNTSLISIKSQFKNKEINLNEPAINIMNTVANLKQISQGIYNDELPDRKIVCLGERRSSTTSEKSIRKKLLTGDRFYEECMFYLISYGGHINILEFFIRNNLLTSALRYIQIKHLDAKIFIHYIFLPHLKRGDIATIINELTEMDKTLGMWKETIIQTCLYLEIKKLYNSLYQMQVLLKDVVRAAMTCVRFYSMNCANFTDLHNHTIHLTNAQSHLQTELEKCYFDVKETRRKSNDLEKSLFMKMDLKMINGHINTISRQIEVVKFLAACEKCGKQTLELLPKIFMGELSLPTLFGDSQMKIQLAVLCLVCGSNIEEGFGLSYRIIQDSSLNTSKVYSLTARYLAGNKRITEVEQLVQCIKSNTISNIDCIESFCDEIVCSSIETAYSHFGEESKPELENLLRKITDIQIKTKCYITTGQLKSAYLLAVQSNNLTDIRKILRQSEILKQPHIKRLCERKLGGDIVPNPPGSNHSSDSN